MTVSELKSAFVMVIKKEAELVYFALEHVNLLACKLIIILIIFFCRLYLTNIFKHEFGETQTSFVTIAKKIIMI